MAAALLSVPVPAALVAQLDHELPTLLDATMSDAVLEEAATPVDQLAHELALDDAATSPDPVPIAVIDVAPGV